MSLTSWQRKGRSKGYVVETSQEKDRCGFAYHRLVRVPTAKQMALTVERRA
jgi:hypothetical protein